jgi:tetratricopeptide (TPR) repeat protein
MLGSCQKFLDIKKTSSQSFLTTPQDCQLLMDDYTKMNTGYPVDGEISADDYFINEATYRLVSTPAIPQEEKDLFSWTATAQRTAASQNWTGPYQVIYSANLVLEAMDKLKDGAEDPVLRNTVRGQALFFRAFSLWTMAQLYTKPYSSVTASQHPGMPIHLDPDVNVKSNRLTVQDTYNQILQDLNESTALLPVTSSIATRPNKRAAYAMLARTYLSMGDYPNALANAHAAIQLNGVLLDYNSSLVSKTSNTAFTRFNSEVIFHAVMYNKTSAPIGGLVLAPGAAAFNTAKIDQALVASYANNDLRSKVFLKPNSGTHAGTYRFTGNYEQAATAAFFVGLANDEMYLIRAECYARTGRKELAMQDLNTLLSKRWVTGTYTDMSASSDDDALAKILIERRKELLMRGLRWSDLRRLKISITRTVVMSSGPNLVFTLPANDPRYTLLIPKFVIDNSGIAQNQR